MFNKAKQLLKATTQLIIKTTILTTLSFVPAKAEIDSIEHIKCYINLLSTKDNFKNNAELTQNDTSLQGLKYFTLNELQYETHLENLKHLFNLWVLQPNIEWQTVEKQMKPSIESSREKFNYRFPPVPEPEKDPGPLEENLKTTEEENNIDLKYTHRGFAKTIEAAERLHRRNNVNTADAIPIEIRIQIKEEALRARAELHIESLTEMGFYATALTTTKILPVSPKPENQKIEERINNQRVNEAAHCFATLVKNESKSEAINFLSKALAAEPDILRKAVKLLERNQ